jgi:hypothetical protein
MIFATRLNWLRRRRRRRRRRRSGLIERRRWSWIGIRRGFFNLGAGLATMA